MSIMGREYPTLVQRPSANRRDDRAKRARDTKNKVIPDLLRSCPRAKHGIARAERIDDPPPVHESSRQGSDPFPRPDLKIRVTDDDVLTAAWKKINKSGTSRPATGTGISRTERPNIGLLSMASAVNPGGGFLRGANAQEEWICNRTTLYASLWDSFYRLPEFGGIYTPDVLVFRDHLAEANDLPKSQRYYVDVISSSMFRFSDLRADGCTCGLSFCDKHRDMVMRKMKAVLRIAQSKGIQRLILGAWGCGVYKCPVVPMAKLWRKVIAGAPRQRRPNTEQWEGINEIIFAVPDPAIFREFKHAFSDVQSPDSPPPEEDNTSESQPTDSVEAQRASELLHKIAETEMRIQSEHNVRIKHSLRATLADLQRQLHHGTSNEDEEEEDSPEEVEEAEDYVMAGFHGSDDEYNPFFVGHDLDSDSDVAGAAESFEFRPPPPGMDPHTSHDEESQDESLFPALSHSPSFDPETGWFTGSMDGLTALINSGGGLRSCSRNSPRTPDVVRPTSSGLPIDADALHDYLRKHEGTDVQDY